MPTCSSEASYALAAQTMRPEKFLHVIILQDHVTNQSFDINAHKSYDDIADKYLLIVAVRRLEELEAITIRQYQSESGGQPVSQKVNWFDNLKREKRIENCFNQRPRTDLSARIYYFKLIVRK